MRSEYASREYEAHRGASRRVCSTGVSVFIVKSIDFPVGTASAAHVRLIVKGLRENGCRAAVVSTSRISHLGADNSRSIGHYDGCPYLHMSQKEPGVTFIGSLLQSWKGDLRLLSLLRRRRRKGREDVVLYGNGSPAHDWPLLLGCWLFRLPLLALCVELDSAPWEARRDLREKCNYWNGRWAEEWLPRITRGYVVISERLESFYRKRHASVLLAPILVDPSAGNGAVAGGNKPSPLYPGRRVMLYSGTFEEKDGVHYLLDALSTVKRSQPDVLLVMTGKAIRRGGASTMARVRDHINRAGLEDHTELTGFIPRHELEALTRRADVLLVCRTKGEFAQFGFPWKLGEYAMAGKPILATDVSDISRYFEDRRSIFFAQPEDARSIADGMIAILNDDDLARTVGRCGYETAATRFNYRDHGRTMVRFITRCVHEDD